jgi:hypothetical protein
MVKFALSSLIHPDLLCMSQNDPDYDYLRDDPRFQALMKKLQ